MIGFISAAGARGYCWIGGQDGESYYGHFTKFINAPAGHFRCGLRVGMEVSFDVAETKSGPSLAAKDIAITGSVQAPDSEQIQCEWIRWDEGGDFGFARLPCNCRCFVHISDIVTAEEYFYHLVPGARLVMDVKGDKLGRLRGFNVEILKEES